MNYLNNPSSEQKEILLSLESNNVTVYAVAGSGKTTTCLHIAKKFQENKILLLTYNARLKQETREKRTNLQLTNLDVQSFHSFAIKSYGVKSFTDSGIQQIINSNKKPLKINNYELIIIDEAQDITPLYFQFLCKILKDNGLKAKLCILGDKFQTIYKFKDADSRYLEYADEFLKKYNNLPWKKCKLGESFRITKSLSIFLNECCFKEEFITSNKDVAYKPEYLVMNIFDTFSISKKIKELLKTYTNDDIFILSAYINGKNTSPFKRLSIQLVNDGIDCHVSNNQDEELDPRVISGKIVFTSFHQVKGLERKVVVILGFDNSFFNYGYGSHYNPNIIPNEFYVALTRSLEKLVLIHHNDKPFLKFLDIEKIKDYCSVLPSFDFYKKKLLKLADEEIINLKNPVVSVTDLIKFMPQDMINTIKQNINIIKIDNNKDNNIISIDNVILQKNNKWEQVSDITGIAVPTFYEYQCKKDIKKISILISLKKLIERNDDYVKEEYSFILKYQDFIFNLWEKEKLEIQDLLLLSNLWISFMEKLNFKLEQIDKDKYNWISEENLTKLIGRMKKHVSDNSNYEKEYTNYDFKNIYGKILRGYLDNIDVKNKCIWEFKCVKELKDEYYVQLLTYAYLFESQRKKDLMEVIKSKVKIFDVEEIKVNNQISVNKNSITEKGKVIKITKKSIQILNKKNKKIKINYEDFIKNETLEKRILKQEKELIEKYQFFIFNILHEEIYEVTFNFDDLYKIIDKLIWNKFFNRNIKSDNEFLEYVFNSNFLEF